MRLDSGMNLSAEQVILMLNPSHELIEALTDASLASLAAALTAISALATSIAAFATAAVAAFTVALALASFARVQLLLRPTTLVLVLGRVYLGLADPQDVVLVGLLDLPLLFELLQVAAFLGLLSLLGELAAQHTQYEVHDEERADYNERDEVEVRP